MGLMTKSKAKYKIRCSNKDYFKFVVFKGRGHANLVVILNVLGLVWSYWEIFFSQVDEKPGSAGSRKEKEKEVLKSPVHDLVEVKSSGYSKKWVQVLFLNEILPI